MINEERRSAFSDNNSDTESISSDRVAFSGPIGGPTNLNKRRSSYRKSARFNLPDDTITNADDSLEVTLEIRGDSVAVRGIQETDKDTELSRQIKRTLENSNNPGNSSRSQFRNTSSSIKKVSQELKRLTTLLRRPPASKGLDRTNSTTANALKGLKFIAAKTGSGNDWPSFEKKFNDLTAPTKGLLPSSVFGDCIGMNKESKEFAGELFSALARRNNINSDAINKDQFKKFWEQITDERFDSRLLIFFDMVDRDADGKITEKEIAEIISLSASANQLSNIQKQAREYAALIMEELDPDHAGYIMIHNLETLLLQAPNHSVSMGDSRLMSQMLSDQLEATQESNPIQIWYQRVKYFLMDSWQRVWVMMLWLGVVSGLFIYKFVQYRNKEVFEVMGYCICVAKGGAEILKFNMALILFPVCRNTMTWLRNKTKLGKVVPLDDNINFHMVISCMIAVGVGLHAIAHLACDFPRLLNVDEDAYEPMKPYFGEEKPPNYWWFLKGVEGVTGIIMVVVMAIAFTQAMPVTPCLRLKKLNLPTLLMRFTDFNAFWYSHHLFIIVYTLLVVHGIYLYLTKIWYQKTTWMYLAVPVTLYACERLVRFFRSSIKPVKIVKVAIYPGKVLALHMSKPQGFRYKSGQYMFINCPRVSSFEWHPFSITSAPYDDYLSVHIRALGDWTKELKDVFSKVCKPSTAGENGQLRADEHTPSLPKILIDGPYGAPAQDYKKYDVVLLAGLGIGATPMISILKDIISSVKNRDREEGDSLGVLEAGGSDSGNKSRVSYATTPTRGSNNKVFRTQKAYFYWVTREQGSFEWFKGIMNEVAEMDDKQVIELHNHCTSVYEEGDARSALISMLQSIHHAKNGEDLVSGTRVKSHFAKPNWRQVYKKIALQHPDSRVGVFYCGHPTVAKDLKQLALDFSHRTSTKFEFHKENF